MSIYFGNLSYDATQENLKTVFAEYGNVTKVYVPSDRETGRPRGFAFLDMSSDAEEEKAIEELEQAVWMSRTIKENRA